MFVTWNHNTSAPETTTRLTPETTTLLHLKPQHVWHLNPQHFWQLPREYTSYNYLAPKRTACLTNHFHQKTQKNMCYILLLQRQYSINLLHVKALLNAQSLSWHLPWNLVTISCNFYMKTKTTFFTAKMTDFFNLQLITENNNFLKRPSENNRMYDA